MLETLIAAWRARHVLLTGGRDEVLVPLEAWLTMLGAQIVCLPPQADAETLYRALTASRISAVIVSRPPAGSTLLGEIRETGVPLTLLCAPGDGQDAALGALIFGARFFCEGDMPCGVYDLGDLQKSCPTLPGEHLL